MKISTNPDRSQISCIPSGCSRNLLTGYRRSTQASTSGYYLATLAGCGVPAFRVDGSMGRWGD